MTRRPLVLLALAGASATGAFLVWLAAFHVQSARVLDERALHTFTGATRLPSSPSTPSISGVALLADPVPFAVIGMALVVLALLRGRWLVAAAVPAILLSANLATQALKPALASTRHVDLARFSVDYHGSWPSGHSTASMSLALCLVLVAPQRLRPLAALAGAGYAVAVGYALVALGAHLPSDVLGGYLVAATATLLGAAAVVGLEARLPVRARRVTVPPALLSAPALGVIAGVGLAAVAITVLVHAPSAPSYAVQHPTAVLAGIGIAGLGLALTSGLARVLRR